MHGSRNVIIVGNQFSRNVLWSIGLMPGTGSHGAENDDGVAVPPNTDGSSIIANNIISDFGYGDAYWVWKDDEMLKCIFRFDVGQELNDPPLTDVVITGNVIQATESSRFGYAIFIGTSDPQRGESPRGLHFSNNIFPEGMDGVSNQPLTQ
jgi:hypothetical protein